MLDYTRRRAAAADTTVSLHRAGFLTYRHEGPAATVVTTKSALHQLPDFWKQAALSNIASYLEPRGLLYIWDLIYTFPPADYAAHLDRLVDDFGQPEGGGFSRADFETHIREEFSTYGWILEGLLDRAGFDVLESNYVSTTHGELRCQRRPGSLG